MCASNNIAEKYFQAQIYVIIYFCERKKSKGSICKADVQLSLAVECVKWELKLQWFRKYYLLAKEPPPEWFVEMF